jgi:hypothetical protein
LRRLATSADANQDPDRAAARLTKSADLSQDAIARQRQIASRSALPADRFDLAQLLQSEVEYLLSQAGVPSSASPERAAAAKLHADALLTEAIQLCRALAAEFPDDTKYKDRLTALLKLQSQHFGEQDSAKSPTP